MMMIRGAGLLRLLVLLILGASLASAASDACDTTAASDFGEAYNNYYTRQHVPVMSPSIAPTSYYTS